MLVRGFQAISRQEIVEETAASKKYVAAKSGDVQDALIDQDTGYGHAVMMQCFLPQRPILDREYKTFHGRASLLIEAGQIANPKPAAAMDKVRCPLGPQAVPDPAVHRPVRPYAATAPR